MVQTAAFKHILSELKPHNATMVAVSKFKSIEDIQTLYDLGHRDFGENYVQELVEKRAALPKDIRWHFIGNLQRNKVRDIVDFVHLIHGVDSYRLFKEINKRAANVGREVSCLLQMHIAEEETKFGLDEKELVEFFEFMDKEKESLSNVKIVGLMGMATFTENQDQIRAEFAKLKNLMSFVKNSYFIGKDDFEILSMGMSNDYQIALEEGATLVRIGSLIFGNRQAR